MSLQKQNCSLAEKARTCMADIKAVTRGEFDMIRWMNHVAFEAKITEVERALDVYNTRLQEADNARKVFESKQRELEELAQQFLPQIVLPMLEEETPVAEAKLSPAKSTK